MLEQGAHRVFDHSADGYLKQITDATSGRGVNLILEMLSNVNLGNDLTILSQFGRVVVIGSRGNVEINPRDTMRRDADILGMTLLNVSEDELRSIHAAIFAGLENGAIRPVIDEELLLSQAAKAHQEVMGSGSKGKIILLP